MGNSQEETALHLLIIKGAIRRMGMYLVSVFVTPRVTVVICSPLSVCYMPLTIVNTLPAAAFIRRIGHRVLQSVRGGDGRATRRSRLHGLIILHTISLVCLSDFLLTTPSSVFYPLALSMAWLLVELMAVTTDYSRARAMASSMARSMVMLMAWLLAELMAATTDHSRAQARACTMASSRSMLVLPLCDRIGVIPRRWRCRHHCHCDRLVRRPLIL